MFQNDFYRVFQNDPGPPNKQPFGLINQGLILVMLTYTRGYSTTTLNASVERALRLFADDQLLAHLLLQVRGTLASKVTP